MSQPADSEFEAGYSYALKCFYEDRKDLIAERDALQTKLTRLIEAAELAAPVVRGGVERATFYAAIAEAKKEVP